MPSVKTIMAISEICLVTSLWPVHTENQFHRLLLCFLRAFHGPFEQILTSWANTCQSEQQRH